MRRIVVGSVHCIFIFILKILFDFSFMNSFIHFLQCATQYDKFVSIRGIFCTFYTYILLNFSYPIAVIFVTQQINVLILCKKFFIVKCCLAFIFRMFLLLPLQNSFVASENSPFYCIL